MTEHAPLMEQARVWADEGQDLVLATVVETWGSSPCPAGSQMIINEEAGFAGSVSGGCIETTVVSESLEVMREGGFEVSEYGITDEQSATAGLACGGRLVVMKEVLDADLLAVLSGPRPAVRVVDLQTGTWALVRDGKASGALALGEEALDQAEAAIDEERARVFDADNTRLFIQPLLLPYRMLIVGAVRIAQALAPMASEAGFDVTVIDPRRAFATQERFPHSRLVLDWPDKALDGLELDARTALVTLTHDEKPDDMALMKVLKSKAFYVGALGSRKTHAKRVERLNLYGLSTEEIARIHAPVGLDIGARGPAEIAISILAQVVAVKNAKGESG